MCGAACILPFALSAAGLGLAEDAFQSWSLRITMEREIRQGWSVGFTGEINTGGRKTARVMLQW